MSFIEQKLKEFDEMVKECDQAVKECRSIEWYEKQYKRMSKLFSSSLSELLEKCKGCAPDSDDQFGFNDESWKAGIKQFLENINKLTK